MKCKIPEISWHNRDPVLSVDIQPNCVVKNESTICRLASGGTDAHVLIWYVNRSADGADIELDLATDLSRHQRAVNTVRWSPNGELLASGDDESVVFIWKLKGENEVVNIVDDTNDQDKETWITLKVLRGHTEDIYDLSWSPNSQFLVTGSVDNTAMMWDVHKGKSMAILDDHKGYVQGVAWDPRNQYIATMSTDRHLRIFDIHTKKVLHRVSKTTLPVPEGSELYEKSIRLYHDGTLQTFFRRLCFTPDGKLLLTPAGVTDYDGVSKPLHTTYGYSRYDFKQPAFVLPCPDQYTVAVRSSPILYKLRPYNPEKCAPVIALPYRMIFAVATKSSIYFYDTQQKQPFAVISNIHYTRLTDLTWSSDGCVVVVSSTDGFCSLITFNADDLGEIYEDSEAVLGAVVEYENNQKANKKNGKKNKMRKLSGDDPTIRKPLQDKSVNSIKDAKSVAITRKPSLVEEIDEDGNGETDGEALKNVAMPISIKRREATPIAIKRKPSQPQTTLPNNTDNAQVITQSTSTAEKVTTPIAVKSKDPTPIAIKRKPNTAQDISESTPSTAANVGEQRAAGNVELESVKLSPKKVESKLPIAAEIIIDKEILSTDERFESPEKKSRPVTPIMVRRHPRTPNSGTTTTSTSTSTPSQKTKRATPIAVRRTPRTLIATPVNAPTVMEEAMDAWPLEEVQDTTQTTQKSPEKPEQSEKKSTVVAPPTPSELTVERTEDIRLVYEETVEEAPTNTAEQSVPVAAKDDDIVAIPKQNEQTPNGKTPRRVALRTISTPKSKKKILD